MKFNGVAGLVLLLAVVGSSSPARGGACCGGSSAAPGIITSDDQAQFSFHFSRSEVIGDAPAEGRAVFRSSDDQEITQTLSLDGAILLSDRLQASLHFPWVMKERSLGSVSETANRLGDLSLGLTHETFPQWTYSPWVPRGYTFLQWTLPTGRSLYETQTLTAVDSTGLGVFALTGGVLLLKEWGDFDVNFSPLLTYRFPRSFGDGSRVSMGWAAHVTLGAGWSPGAGPFRVGLSATPNYLQGRQVEALGITTRSPPQSNLDVALELAYLAGDQWSLNAQYLDQTLLGPARNTTLSRGVTVGFQHRWAR